MSPICQTFVQNTWRKDLCSNCFKSEDEHGNPNSEYDYRLTKNYANGGSIIGKRYNGLGSTNGIYARSYYGSTTWKSMMLDNSNNDSRVLKSPGLIKGMNNIIKKENEKNKQFSSGFSSHLHKEPTTVYNVSNLPRDSWILSQILSETKSLKTSDRSERLQGDSSSDLGSDASHESSLSSGNNSGCSETEIKADSDSSSIKSEQDSAHEEEIVRGILKTSAVKTFLRDFKTSISFKDDHEVIGYGGDVDYSDEEELSAGDDSEDDSSISSLDLNSEERSLKRITEKNTDFNSFNVNLESDHAFKQAKMNNNNKNDNNIFLKSFEEKDFSNDNDKFDVKVKLKRSQPIIGCKPLIKTNSSNIYSSGFTENAVDSRSPNMEREIIPMQDIKPKYVSRENEMKETSKYEIIYPSGIENNQSVDKHSKITSIDEITRKNDYSKSGLEIPNSSSKITSIDDHINIQQPDRNAKLPNTHVDSTHMSDFDLKPPAIVKRKTKITDLDKYMRDIQETETHTQSKTSLDPLNLKDKSKDKREKSNMQDLSEKISCNDLTSKENVSRKANANNKEESISVFNGEKTSDDLREVSKPVVNPVNIMNIKRRSSFMESQLGDSAFSIDNARGLDSNGKNLVDIQKATKSISDSSNSKSLADIQKITKSVSDSSKSMSLADIQKITKSVSDSSNSKSLADIQKITKSVSDSSNSKSLANTEKAVTSIPNSVASNDSVCRNDLSSKSNVLFGRESRNAVWEASNDHSLDKNSVNRSNDHLSKSNRENIGKNNFTNTSETSKTESNVNCITQTRNPKLNLENREENKILTSVANKKIDSCKDENEKIHKPSRSLSTFGMPFASSKAPNSSFLHSKHFQPLTEPGKIKEVINSTPELLKEINSCYEEPTGTASIKKSNVYASSSSLNGNCSKPALTPKPGYLKEKSRNPTSINSFAPGQNTTKCANAMFPKSINGIVDNSSSTLLYDGSSEHGEKEVVYDLPVTSAITSSIPSPSSCSSSSGYSTSNVSQSSEHSDHKEPEITSNSTETTSNSLNHNSKPNGDNEKELLRAKFEATRDILSKTLSFDSRPSINDVEETKETTTTPGISNTESGARLLALATTEQQGNTDTENGFFADDDFSNNHTPYDHQDVDSYSSFTDDFDDDDDQEFEDDDEITNNRTKLYTNQSKNFPVQPDRSSSALPSLKNSVGLINFSAQDIPGIASLQNAFCSSLGTKDTACRSQSVPRSGEIMINRPSRTKEKHETSSRFSFVKSGFFRSSSPPAPKLKSFSSDRGRERTKRSTQSVLFLRKLLKMGSAEKFSRVTRRDTKNTCKDSEERLDRETRKKRLQIIHPLDYNTNGVEVIARPERREPSYDLLDIEDPKLQAALRMQSLENVPKTCSESQSTVSMAPNESSWKERSSLRRIAKKNSFLRKKKKKDRGSSDNVQTTSQPTVTYVRDVESQRMIHAKINNGKTRRLSCGPATKPLGYMSCSTGNVSSSVSTSAHLGFNSEGRPKPPPPPRKTSLESSHDQEPLKSSHEPEPLKNSSLRSRRRNSSIDVSNPSSSETNKPDGDNSSLSSSCSSTRPHRPPPPRRTPSNVLGVPTGLNAPEVRTKDSVYENLGNARASFTPRKPGRTSSIRDDEREKRRAPLPPQDHKLNAKSCKNAMEFFTKSRKTLAPSTPQIYSTNVEEKERSLSTVSSTSAGRKLKPRARRSSVVTNLSLEDQYGAVISANLEALTNILDQMSNCTEFEGYEKVKQELVTFSQLKISSDTFLKCGSKVFREATGSNLPLTIMITTEAKIESDMLSILCPIACFNDEVPSGIFRPLDERPDDKLLDGFVNAKICVYPRMELCYLEEFAQSCQVLLNRNPIEWERRTVLLLLQLVTALKQLQAKGIEETSFSSMIVISKFMYDDNPRLLIMENEVSNQFTISNDEGEVSANGMNCHVMSLCHCAASVVQMLLGNSFPDDCSVKDSVLCSPLVPTPHAFSTLVSILREERANSLTKVKCLLEVMLYGPPPEEANINSQSDSVLQKWLDLERTNMLHSLVKDQTNGTLDKTCVQTRFNLTFLVRTNVKTLKESMKALEAPNVSKL